MSSAIISSSSGSTSSTGMSSISSHTASSEMVTEVFSFSAPRPDAPRLAPLAPERVATPPAAKQYKINFICSQLQLCKIHTRKNLIENFGRVVGQICQNPKIFNAQHTAKQNFEIFREAIRSYSAIHALKLTLTENDAPLFNKALALGLPEEAPAPIEGDDLSRVTQNYDRFATSRAKIKKTNQGIATLLEGRGFVECPHIILGSGDTGTSIWLDKYKRHHGQTHKKLTRGEVPDVLMIGESFGSWKQDYSLAQPYSLLERGSERWNPSDYVTREHYASNPRVNARHAYQANVANLAKTDAPLLETKVLRIEKKGNHLADWRSRDYAYRLIIATPHGQKAIYTNEVDICTGLGPAKNGLTGPVMPQNEFERLNRFDPKKKCTPIVDGNQFILTDAEEHSPTGKTVVVYGGGGTAAACYRKAFFGHDVRTEDLEFRDESRKNRTLWIGRDGFAAAGSGKLATSALTGAGRRHELRTAELRAVREDAETGKLHLSFMPSSKGDKEIVPPSLFEIECDQLVYSMGQEDSELRRLTREFDAELALDTDVTGIPFGVKTPDARIHFFGAAAQAIKPKEYTAATWKWLHEENIGPDVGPGSMPPSRSQIKHHLSKLGIHTTSINVNMDTRYLIRAFLLQAGVPSDRIAPFIADILEARKIGPGGFSHEALQGLLDKHRLNDLLQIRGHGHLVKKIR